MMLKPILSVTGGLAIAFALVFVTDALFHALVPSAAAAPTDMSDREAMRAYVASQPPAALVAILLGWTVAVFAGSAVAARFADRGTWPGWTVGGLFLLATVGNFAIAPHPTWMVASAILLILIGAWAGTRAGLRKRSIAAVAQ